ncbi:MAG: NAD-dependent epimerase/dehydratase family protein [Acidobacteria bacterium]|nr:NAD-dependent epimerase/dehydratase family protein [Acidobacteriota bacterium]
MQVLVTGGAGFIGTHLATGLDERGYGVRVLDSFVEQVHGGNHAQLGPSVQVVRGDVRDRATVERALEDVEIVFHDAAEVGVGQSMYTIERYVSANSLGTAVLLEAMIGRRNQIKTLIVASSMSIYGEGAYRCERHGPIDVSLRSRDQLERRDWDMRCPSCDDVLQSVPTRETKTARPTSVYALTKYDQEQLCLMIGRAYGIRTIALRYFNVYGAGQALSNPYTGVAAIFSSRLLNGRPPIVFEDGRQTRDFTHVSDIVQANVKAAESDATDEIFNVGTGVATPLLDLQAALARHLGSDIKPAIVGRFREGDIRHCVADIGCARARLGYEPCVTLDEGVPQLVGWVRSQRPVDRIGEATGELETRGLVR